MKRICLIIFLLMGTLLLNAQDTIQIFKENKDCREIYYVLKDNDTIKHGSYLKFNTAVKSNMLGFRIFEKGFFQNNKKSGHWKYCYDYYKYDIKSVLSRDTKEYLWSQGNYLDGNKMDIWDYYHPTGNFHVKYNHSTNNLILYIDTLGNDRTQELERYPIYLGYEPFLQRDLFLHLKNILDQTKSLYYIKISFTLDTIGRASNFQIIDKKGSKKFGDYCLEFAKLLGSRWLPAAVNNINKNSEVIFEVRIDLTEYSYSVQWEADKWGYAEKRPEILKTPVKIIINFDYKII
jgi:hypothetical protein